MWGGWVVFVISFFRVRKKPRHISLHLCSGSSIRVSVAASALDWSWGLQIGVGVLVVIAAGFALPATLRSDWG